MAGHEVSLVATTDLSLGRRGLPTEGDAGLDELGVPVRFAPFKPGPVGLTRSAAAVGLRRSSLEASLYDSDELSAEVSRLVEETRPDVLHVDRPRALSLVRPLSIPLDVDVTDPRFATYRHYSAAGRQRPVSLGLREKLRARLDRSPAEREETRGLGGVPTLVASEIGRRDLIAAIDEPRTVSCVPNPVFAEERAEILGFRPDGPLMIGMSGNLSYPPNVHAFETLAREIFPVLRREADARLVVVGSSPHRRLRRTAMRVGASIHQDVASVPLTLRELGVATMVSPQAISTGFPNRVVDAAYRAGAPIVVSPQTARGAPEELARALPVADSPEEWSSEILRLSVPAVGGDLVAELQDRIDETCSAERVAALLVDAYAEAMSSS
jgi:hypothetical protein